MFSVIPILLATLGCFAGLSLSAWGTALGISRVVTAFLAVGLLSPDKPSSYGLFIIFMLTMTSVLGFIVAVQIIAFVDDLPFGVGAVSIGMLKKRSPVPFDSEKWAGGIRAGSYLTGVGLISGVTNLLTGMVMGKLGNDLIIAMNRSPSFGQAMVPLLFASILNLIGFVVAQLILMQITVR